MQIALIVARAANGCIGRNNSLPWYLPGDLKYFKRVTLGKPVIMGRKTWESLKGPLPGRANIVISRQPGYQADGARVVTTLDDALAIAEAVVHIEGGEEVMVIGGAQIYAEALPRVTRMYVTEVHAEVDGDAFFPPCDMDAWEEVGREDFAAEGPNPHDYSFVIYQRAGSAG